jgi:germination protein M
MNKQRRILAGLLGVVLLVTSLGGCYRTDSGIRESETLSENQDYVYYRDGDSYTLTPVAVEVEGKSRQEQIRFLYNMLKEPEDSTLAAAVPKDLMLVSTYMDDNNLIMNFSSNYTKMEETEEILCRAAIVKTILQVEGIQGISFNVSDQALVSSSGRTIGVMTQDSFESSLNQTLKETELVLYFADETGQGLKTERHTVVYRSGQNLERLVIQELIQGPETGDCYPVLDSNLKLTNISVSDNVCYVYFDSTFLQNTLDVADYIPIYAIVNSLSELSNISRVQFVIDGSQDAVFRENISLSGTLSRNQNYIIEE